MRKIILFLSVIILLSITVFIPSNAASIFIDSEDSLYEDYDYKTYKSKDGNYLYQYAEIPFDAEENDHISTSKTDIIIKKYIGKKTLLKNFSIPKKVDGKNVSEIGKKAFCGQDVRELTIPKNIFKINPKAFYNCKKLKKITFKYSSFACTVDKEAFAGCSELKKINLGKRELNIKSKSFYNCPKLKSFSCYFGSTINFKKTFGYYYDSKSKTDKKVKNFSIKLKCGRYGIGGTPLEYANKNKMKAVVNLDKEELNLVKSLYAVIGHSYYLRYDNTPIKTGKSSNTKVVDFTNDGKMMCLQGGKTQITLTMSNGKKVTVNLHVSNGPDYNYPDIKVTNRYDTKYHYNNDKKKYGEYIYVRKGSVINLPIVYGKVNEIDNIYTNSKKAIFVSKPSARTIKIKGISIGKTTLKVKVNGVKTIKIKVKVTK